MKTNSNILEQVLAGKVKGVVIQIDGDQLAEALMSVVRDATAKAAARAADNARNELVTCGETMQILDVGRTTLYEWEKKGILKPARIGSRVYYRRSDLDEMLNNDK